MLSTGHKIKLAVVLFLMVGSFFGGFMTYRNFFQPKIEIKEGTEGMTYYQLCEEIEKQKIPKKILQKLKVGEPILEQYDQVQKILKYKLDFDPGISINYGLMIEQNSLKYGPMLGLSFMKFSNQNGILLRFPEVLVGTTNFQDIAIEVVPVSLNIGNFLPIIDNTYVKPYVGLRNTNFNFGIGLGVNF